MRRPRCQYPADRSGAIVAVRPIGVLKMMDEAGGDEKIIAVPIPKLTQRYAHVTTTPIYRKLPGARSSISLHTTRTSKRKRVTFGGWGDADEAKRFIREAIERAKIQRSTQA